MSIRLLEVEGFKSLKEVSWRPGNLNVIIGPNGSGKSNLLNGLDLLRSAASGKLGARVQAEGGILALLWDGRAEEVKLHLTNAYHFGAEAHGDFSYELNLAKEYPWNGYEISHERFVTHSNVTGDAPHLYIGRTHDTAMLYDPRSDELSPIEGTLNGEEALLASGSSPLAPLDVALLSTSLKSWVIHRTIDTSADATVRQSTVTRRETVVDADGENLIAVLHTLYTEDREFRSDLNAAMRAAFNDSFEELVFPPASDQRVQLRVNWKHLKRSQPSAMLSDGTLRFLYLMAILATPEPPALIAIEEPEVGLHPSMFPIIAEYAVQASKRTQVIFTTHSADFLDAFRDTGVAPTTTVTQWRDGATTLKVLEGEELAYWLREYTLGQLFRSSELEQIG